MATWLIRKAARAEREDMESSAHRQPGSDGDRTTLSAAQRADLRWGLERVLLRRAEEGSDDLARALQRALRHLPVVMLHDRMLPGGLLAEHLAVGPGGVTVIAGWAAGDVVAPLTVERLRGIFGARAELLRDGDQADRTALLTPIHERMAVLDGVIDGWSPIAGALCLDGDGPVHLRPLVVEGVTIAGPKAIAELAARDGDLHDYELAALVDLLDRALPVAL
jgi:hypothetical protein